MNVKATLISLYIGMLSTASFQAHSDILFEDSFESGDLSATNTEGFSWGGTNRTSIVTSTARVYANDSPDSTPKANISPSGDWTPKTGEHSLRFNYPTNAEWSEQRFNLGTPKKEIWFRYWLRVPTNFAFGPVGNPDKFFALWMDGYSQAGQGSTVWLSMSREGTANASIWFSYSQGDYNHSGGSKQNTSFIKTSDAGRWMQVVIHIKAESSDGANDGAFDFYRRWENESSFTQIHHGTGLGIKVASSPAGFKNGYILGWHQLYSENTEWLLDDFTVSDTPLIITPRKVSAFVVE